MSASALIMSMEKLLKLHQSLYELAVSKTEILKKGDMEDLTEMIKTEQAHISAIGKLDEDRVCQAKVILPNLENPTLSECIEALNGTEKETLVKLQEALVDTIKNIQKQNELNQQLLQQSLQFVNLSMSLFMPQDPEDFVYGNPIRKSENSSPSSGIFNSKA